MDKPAIKSILSSVEHKVLETTAIASTPLEMSIIDAVAHYLESKGWRYVQEESDLLHTTFQIDTYQWDCYIQSFAAQQQLLIYSILPTIAPPDKKAAILELLTRINYELVIGSFDMDIQNGYLSCKTSLDITDSHLDLALLHNLFQANFETVVYYLSAFNGVIQEGRLPDEARSRL
ncbi:MAG: YbjN domain-containing protein [Spirulinaceae cyanobacterium]